MLTQPISLRRIAGQGMTEYIIIVGLIAIFVIGAVKAFGGKVNEGFTASTGKVGDVVTSINGTN